MRPSILVDGVRYYLARRVDEMNPSTGERITIDAHDIALFLVDGKAVAIQNACPHQGTSLCDGAITNGRVVCPAHAWSFSTETGEGPEGETYKTRLYPTLIRDQIIWIALTETHE